MAHLSSRALGCDCRRRLLRHGSLDVARLGHLLHGVRSRLGLPSRANLGSTPHPEALFMQQAVRTLTMADGGAMSVPQVLICDRDRKWSSGVRRKLRNAGM